jgi:hypothetical protein
MSFKQGDKLRYYFPNPLNSNQKFFDGIVESISEYYIYLKNQNNIRLKVSFKNFEFLVQNNGAKAKKS